MTSEKNPISAVPTNIVTGFLGVGKTTSILNLLEEKPAGERWAILVNEFGEIGVDGSMLSGNKSAHQGVFIREVPGGCMCCAAGLPMQIALNQLLQQARPDRLLIEPTGLGHPKEVLQVLSSAHYKDVLQLQHILTLVDARHFSDTRYTEHDTFNQQIDIADIVVANKSDLYSEEDRVRLHDYLKHSDKKVVHVSYGKIPLALLDGETQAHVPAPSHHHSHPAAGVPISEQTIPEGQWLSAQNQGEGFHSIGWRFCPTLWFDRDALFSFFCGLNVERMKGVFITTTGVFAFNLNRDTLTEIELDDALESRVEIITDTLDPEWEATLLKCIPARG